MFGYFWAAMNYKNVCHNLNWWLGNCKLMVVLDGVNSLFSEHTMIHRYLPDKNFGKNFEFCYFFCPCNNLLMWHIVHGATSSNSWKFMGLLYHVITLSWDNLVIWTLPFNNFLMIKLTHVTTFILWRKYLYVNFFI